MRTVPMPGPERARSQAELLAAQGRGSIRAMLAGIDPKTLTHLMHSWDFWARPEQRAPGGAWRTWLVMAGRGFGKTRAGAEWVRERAERSGQLRIALVGATFAEARSVMVEGESGLLAIAPDAMRPEWEPSLRRLRWPGGAQAFVYSAAEPDSLRGPQHHLAWADEIAKWPAGEAAWDNLAMGMRLGAAPRIVATTTPRPVPLVRRLAAGGERIAITKGSTEANRAGLSPDFIAAMREAYGGTMLGRQELNGELIAEPEGALWTRAILERQRVASAPVLRRVVVAVDPPAGSGPRSDACGIVSVGLGRDGLAYVLEDASVAGLSPEGWAAAVAAVAGRTAADLVIAEANQGGAMVRTVLRLGGTPLPVRLVHAAHGKAVRAEPVAMLYAQGRVWHAGGFPALEDELCGLTADGCYEGPGRSPDRADALVWAVSELMLAGAGEPGVRGL
ncbi:DNA-packaging protein [Sphingomonas sp. 1P06PA]|uniref:DNA-packaging protein n=1 Tax=Sphingomonas sp. 1P06PA TaxID=554121 RepID=UPI0039A51F3B